MPRVTFTAKPVVWIHIRGEDRGPYRTRDDGGLVARFLKWCMDNKICDVLVGGYAGGGGLAHAYEPKDAERAIVWLKEEGAELVEDEP